MKIAKYGRLYWFQLEAVRIERFFLVRLFRKLKLNYIPFTLRFYDQLYLREDKSKYSRLLINHCKKHGIQTYVVLEGASEYTQNHTGHSYLIADYFVCPEENKEWWVEHGIPKGRIRIGHRDREKDDIKEIVFMLPLYGQWDFLHPFYHSGVNIRVMRVIFDFLKRPVVFKLHPKNSSLISQFIPKHRIVEGDAKELIKRYDKIYCFSRCSIRKDCEMLGVDYELVD